jgi:proteasome accessory factor C
MSAEIIDDEVVIDMAEYFEDAPRLAPAEALALLAAGMAITASGQGGEVLEEAVDKLSAALLPEGSEVIDIDLAAEPELVGRLKSAAARNEVVAITYTSLSRDETTEREVEPWSVFSSLGNWYLMGYCRLAADRRVFRVDRIKAAAPIGETFTPPASLPPAEARYVPSIEDVRARIALGPGARWVTEYYPVDVVSDRSEELIVDFSAADPLVAARLLLRLGPDAKLIKGEEVERALAELRQRILDVYRD